MCATRLLACAVLASFAAAPASAQEPSWETTTKYLSGYFGEAGYANMSKDEDISYTYSPGDPFSLQAPPLGTFRYVTYSRHELRKDFVAFATIVEFYEIAIDLKKLDPALFKIEEIKLFEKPFHQLTIAGPKDSAGFTSTRLFESQIQRGTPDFQKRDKPVKHDSTTIVFKNADTAKAASKAFRRAAILSGAKESERDPFKD